MSNCFQQSKCTKCGNCCKKFLITLGKDKFTNIFRDSAVRTFEKTFGFKLKNYEDMKILFKGVCEHYDDVNKRCKKYQDRPEVCRNFYCEKCVHNPETVQEVPQPKEVSIGNSKG